MPQNPTRAALLASVIRALVEAGQINSREKVLLLAEALTPAVALLGDRDLFDAVKAALDGRAKQIERDLIDAQEEWFLRREIREAVSRN